MWNDDRAGHNAIMRLNGKPNLARGCAQEDVIAFL